MKSNLNRGRKFIRVLFTLAIMTVMFAGCGGGSGSLTVAVTYNGTSIPSPVAISIETDVETCGHEIFAENIIVNSETRGLKNVVFRLEGEIKGKDKPRDIIISNKGCVFVPHVAITQIGSKIKIVNDDAVFHTTNADMNGKSLFNVPLFVGEAPFLQEPMQESGLLEISCTVHSWMKGYIYVHNNPYIGASDDAGMLSLTEIPPGKYQYVAWHEELGEQTGELEIIRGQAVSIKLEFSEVSEPEAEN